MSKLLDQILSLVKEKPWLFLLVFGVLLSAIAALGVVPIEKAPYRIDAYGRIALFGIGLLAIFYALVKLSKDPEPNGNHDLLNELLKCGVQNAFRVPTEARQKEVKRLINEEVENSGKFRLLAMSGYSYLNPNGAVWKHAGLSKIITEEKATFDVVLQSPFSFFAFNRAIANRVEHSHWDEKQKPENLAELLKYSPSLNIMVTEYALNCSLFFTSKSVLYDFYLWSAPNSSDRTENNFMALEFKRASGSRYDSYRLLEKHYDFFLTKSIPLEEFLHTPESGQKHIYGREFYYLYKANPELALNRYLLMKDAFDRKLHNYNNKPTNTMVDWTIYEEINR